MQFLFWFLTSVVVALNIPESRRVAPNAVDSNTIPATQESINFTDDKKTINTRELSGKQYCYLECIPLLWLGPAWYAGCALECEVNESD